MHILARQSPGVRSIASRFIFLILIDLLRPNRGSLSCSLNTSYFRGLVLQLVLKIESLSAKKNRQVKFSLGGFSSHKASMFTYAD